MMSNVTKKEQMNEKERYFKNIYIKKKSIVKYFLLQFQLPGAISEKDEKKLKE